MLWLSFVIVLLIFPFMFILNMNISSWEVTMWRLDQQKQIQEFLGAIPKVTSKIMIRSRYTVKLIKLSFTLLGYSVPSHIQYCICYFALFSLKIPELELTIIIIRPSPDHVNDVGGHCPWRPLMMPVSLSLFSFILTHHFLNSSLFSFLWLLIFSFVSSLFYLLFCLMIILKLFSSSSLFFFLLPWLPSVHFSFNTKYPALGRLVLIFTFVLFFWTKFAHMDFHVYQSYTEYTSPTGTSNEFIKENPTIFVPVKIFCESSRVPEKSSVKSSWSYFT